MDSQVVMIQEHRDRLRVLLQESKQAALTTGWELSKIIAEIVIKELYLSWHFASVRAWVQQDLAGFYTPSAVSRIGKTIRKLDHMPAAQRVEFESHPFWNVAEALEGDDVDEAAALLLLQSGKTAQEIRYSLKARKKRAADEAGEPPPGEDETFVNLNLPPVPASIAAQFERVCNLARFRLDRDTPHVVTILEHLLVDFEQNWVRDVDPEFLHHTMSDGRELQWTLDDVANGAVRCAKCGSWDRTKLTPHHVIPRSHRCKHCDVLGGHDVPIVLLCASCHRAVTENEQGTWRAYAEELGYGELAAQH